MTDRFRTRFLALLLLALPILAHAQQAPAPVREESLVVMAGEGIVEAVPDRAWVSISSESRAPTPREAQRRNTDLMKPVQDRLRAAGIPADAIRTTAYDLQYEWDYVNNKRVGKGYVARNSIEVRIDAVDRVGEILEIAVGSGATSLGGIRFDLKDRRKLEREALRLAVADARARAEAAASGAGATLDRIIRIQEQGVSVPQPMVRNQAFMKEAAQADAPPISAGEMEIRAQVTLTMSLK